MTTAKIFRNGNSQAVRIPKKFQFDVNEVDVFRQGDDIILRKKRENLMEAFEILSEMPEDFFKEERRDPFPENREEL